jgi:hypothetical protein
VSTFPTLVVQTRNGRVAGTALGRHVGPQGHPAYGPALGEPPVRAPVRGALWNGVRDATAFAPTAPPTGYAAPYTRLFVDPVIPGDVRLTVNVWTPDPAARDLPVLVWIRDGAFRNGARAAPPSTGGPSRATASSSSPPTTGSWTARRADPSGAIATDWYPARPGRSARQARAAGPAPTNLYELAWRPPRSTAGWAPATARPSVRLRHARQRLGRAMAGETPPRTWRRRRGRRGSRSRPTAIPAGGRTTPRTGRSWCSMSAPCGR